jgi:hypothetical protein
MGGADKIMSSIKENKFAHKSDLAVNMSCLVILYH